MCMEKSFANGSNPFRSRREAERAARAASSVANEEVRKLAERREATAGWGPVWSSTVRAWAFP